jgi:signal transduction histidine kinase
MELNRQPTESLKQYRYLHWAGIGLTLVIYLSAVLLVRNQLRHQIRQQIVGRDGEILTAMALMEQYNDESGGNWEGQLEEPGNQLDIVFKLSRLKFVVAARLLDANGKFVHAEPLLVTDANLPTSDVAVLKNLKPISHFYPRARLADYFFQDPEPSGQPEATVPLLEVNVPLHRKGQDRLVGVAQFVINGESIRAEFATLDQHLNRQLAVVTLISSGLILLILGLAFRRDRRINSLLSQRTASLLRANQELSLAAKTSAVGAVTAHLIHGLKNPLSGLQTFVTGRGRNHAVAIGDDWELAAATAGRMKNLIDEVVRVVQDEQGATAYEITLSELVELIGVKVQPVAQAAEVHLEIERSAEGIVNNRDGNLVLLILENLLRNAIQATPKSKTVRLNILATGEDLICEVRDEGAGFPDCLKDSLFSPCRSSKEGGSGIGLAISRQLALHLKAELELKSSNAQGCVFALSLPASVWAGPVIAAEAGAD